MSVCIKFFEFRKVRRNYHTDTVANIGHPFIFATFYICNSNFYGKNPSCSISKFASRILTAEIRVVCISKFATRIFTSEIRVVCISKFATRIFTAKNRVVCVSKLQLEF